MGMDVLNKCNETREHVDGLRHAVKEALDKFINSLDPEEIEEMNLNELEGLPFQNVANLQEVLVVEPKKEDYVVIVRLENTEIDLKLKKSIEQIEDVVKHIEAKGVINLTRTNIIYHTIEVVPGTQPIKQKRRPVPPNYIYAIKKSIIEMEEAGSIEPARSPWCSPIHIVRK